MIRRIGIGVAGVGVMGEIHIQAYLRNPLVRLVGVCDVDLQRVRWIASKYETTAYSTVEDLIAQAEVEAVSICTSDQHHLAPTLCALDGGKHTLLEKPLATTLADADQIIDKDRNTSAKLMIGHIVRFDPRYARIKQMLDDGELGQLETIFARRMNTVDAQDVLKGRVSVLSFLGVHDFDYLRWLAGAEASRVHTETVSKLLKSRGYDVEDNTFTLIRFANGVVGCVESGWALPANLPRKADFKLEAIGTKGVGYVDLVQQGLAVCTADQGFQRPGLGHSIDAEIAHFIDCILEHKQPLIDATDGRAALEISLAAQRSARSGTIVQLPLSE